MFIECGCWSGVWPGPGLQPTCNVHYWGRFNTTGTGLIITNNTFPTTNTDPIYGIARPSDLSLDAQIRGLHIIFLAKMANTRELDDLAEHDCWVEANEVLGHLMNVVAKARRAKSPDEYSCRCEDTEATGPHVPPCPLACQGA